MGLVINYYGLRTKDPDYSRNVRRVFLELGKKLADFQADHEIRSFFEEIKKMPQEEASACLQGTMLFDADVATRIKQDADRDVGAEVVKWALSQ